MIHEASVPVDRRGVWLQGAAAGRSSPDPGGWVRDERWEGARQRTASDSVGDGTRGQGEHRVGDVLVVVQVVGPLDVRGNDQGRVCCAKSSPGFTAKPGLQKSYLESHLVRSGSRRRNVITKVEDAEQVVSKWSCDGNGFDSWRTRRSELTRGIIHEPMRQPEE